jgi:putative endonuclease
MAKWHVYIVECADGTLYTGVATDVRRRVAEHDAGKGARYTRGRGPVRLRYSAPKRTRSAALKEEARIKRLARKEKSELFM